MSEIHHVALVGCGFTGTSAFFQLVDRCPVREITIYEASGRFGPGYPYQSDECPDYLINNTTDTMCLVPANRRAFINWLGDHPELAGDGDAKGHLPRATYGRFLEDVVAATRTAAAIKGIRVNLIPHEATAMRERGGKVEIDSRAGTVVADAAILTTGRCPDRNDYAVPPAGAAARYIANHVRTSAFDDLPLDASVHVLGASLSAYDVVNRLFAPSTGCRFERAAGGDLTFVAGPNQRRVVLCSRSGRLKRMQSRAPAALNRRHFTLEALRATAAAQGLSLADLGQLVQQEAVAHGAVVDWDGALDPYRGCASAEAVNARAGELLQKGIAAVAQGGTGNFLVDFFGNAQITIWDAFAERLLAAGDETAYRAHYETAVLSFAAPCPVPTAERLLALHRAGRLRLVAGVGDVALAPDATHYAIRHRHGVERATTVVNATGALERRVRSPDQPPLIRELVAEGLLAPYRIGGQEANGAAVDMTTLRAEGARNIYLANMLLWGPGFFTSSAFLMATLVERILRGMFPAKAN
ncbi:MAG: FAD/NAD(P)-binding protein [Hyphomicrobiaceae bacterium]